MSKPFFLKRILLSFLFIMSFSANGNSIVAALRAVDSALFGLGLLTVRTISLKYQHDLYGDSPFLTRDSRILMDSMISIRILIEASKIVQRKNAQEQKRETSEIKQLAKALDSIVTSAVFVQLGTALLSRSERHLWNPPAIAAAVLGARCLLHVATTVQPALRYFS